MAEFRQFWVRIGREQSGNSRPAMAQMMAQRTGSVLQPPACWRHDIPEGDDTVLGMPWVVLQDAEGAGI
jgi:hypothetical protein